MPPLKTQLAVIGGGPGGYAAAFLAADLGMEVTLIDPEPNPGGVCLYRGCIPSKALLHVAKVMGEAREAESWGVSFGTPRVNLDRLRSWKDGVVARLTGGMGQLVAQRKIRYWRGRARLLDGRHADVATGSEAAQTMEFDNAVLATGSAIVPLPGLSLRSPRLLNSTDALALADVPPRLLVIGGGYIGLELGTVYAALGSRVTVVEMTPGLLPGVDRDLVRPLARRVEALFESVRTGTRVERLEEIPEGIRVRLEGQDGGSEESVFDKALYSIGRRPNTEGLGLENTKVELEAHGFVKVDAQRRTAEPTLYAVGDLTGQPMLAHKASHEGRVAVEAIAGLPAAFEPRAIPSVVFTDPEIAWCGLTEAQARAEGREVEVTRFPWAASGRALTMGQTDGLTKLIVDPSHHGILGVGICGAGAGELIAEGVLAMEMAATAEDLKMSIHPHPTLSETLMESAEALFGQATSIHRPKRG